MATAKRRVVLVPFPAQGHVTPMLRLARRLYAHPLGFLVTLATPDFIHDRLVACAAADDMDSTRLHFASIPSGLDATAGDNAQKDMAAILKATESDLPEGLRTLLRSDEGTTTTLFMVVDLLAPWAMPVAAEFGIPVAGFWPAMLATYRLVSAIPELRQLGLIDEGGIPVGHQLSDEHPQDSNQGQVHEKIIQLSGQPKLQIKHLPWLVGNSASQKSRFAFWLQILEQAKTLQWLLVNSFSGEGGGKQAQRPSDSDDTPGIFPIGSLLACNIRRNISVWKEDDTCLEWLQRHPPNSVIYVSFGSWVAPVAAEQITELALGLEATGRPFLWMLKEDSAWRAGLPDGYLDRIKGNGKMVAWAPQEEVLQHEATGCFLTHCGWNSTLEAIQHGKKLLCCPIVGDQFVNCTYIVDVWGVGAIPEGLDRNAIHKAIEKIMGSHEGEMIQGRMMELKKQVMGQEGVAKAEDTLQRFINKCHKYFLHKL